MLKLWIVATIFSWVLYDHLFTFFLFYFAVLFPTINKYKFDITWLINTVVCLNTEELIANIAFTTIRRSCSLWFLEGLHAFSFSFLVIGVLQFSPGQGSVTHTVFSRLGTTASLPCRTDSSITDTVSLCLFNGNYQWFQTGLKVTDKGVEVIARSNSNLLM